MEDWEVQATVRQDRRCHVPGRGRARGNGHAVPCSLRLGLTLHYSLSYWPQAKYIFKPLAKISVHNQWSVEPWVWVLHSGLLWLCTIWKISLGQTTWRLWCPWIFIVRCDLSMQGTAQNASIKTGAIANKLYPISPYTTQLKYRRKIDLIL